MIKLRAGWLDAELTKLRFLSSKSSVFFKLQTLLPIDPSQLDFLVSLVMCGLSQRERLNISKRLPGSSKRYYIIIVLLGLARLTIFYLFQNKTKISKFSPDSQNNQISS